MTAGIREAIASLERAMDDLKTAEVAAQRALAELRRVGGLAELRRVVLVELSETEFAIAEAADGGQYRVVTRPFALQVPPRIQRIELFERLDYHDAG